MCGIVGVLGNIGFKEKKAFSRMLELDTVRGPHSTGVILIEGTDNILFDKRVGTPWDFYAKSPLFEGKSGFKGISLKGMIGHNRWATVGKINDRNAHPFNFENVIGVHNGTIYEEFLYDLEKVGGKYEVDSEALYSAINKVGVERAIRTIGGAYSLVYWDKKEKKVKFLRNSQRPMFYTWDKDKKSIFFASEPWIITVACEAADIKLAGIPVSTKADRLYWIDLETNNILTKEGDVGLFYEEDSPIYEALPKKNKVFYRGFTGGIYFPKQNTEKVALINEASTKEGLCPVYYDTKFSEVKVINDYMGKITLFSFFTGGRVEVTFNPKVFNTEKAKKILEQSGKDHTWFYVKLGGYFKETTKEGTKVVLTAYSTELLDLDSPRPWTEIEEVFKQQESEVSLEDNPIKEEKKLTILGKEYSLREFDTLVDDGCSYCGNNAINHEEADSIVWVDFPKTFLCPDCVEVSNLTTFKL